MENLAAGRVWTLSGRMTFHDNDRFLAILAEFAADSGRRVVLDLAGVEYVDSFAIGLLLQAAEQARTSGVTLVISKPSATVRSILEQMDLAGQLPVEPPLQPASGHSATATVAATGGVKLSPLPSERGPGLALSGRFTFAAQGTFLSVLQQMGRLNGGHYRLDLADVSFMDPGFPRWCCDFVTATAKSDIEIKAVRT
ncbi:STAS domain-containing protein, partial [Magnetospirillum moscoviense]